MTYNTSTGAFTVSPNWETTPDNTTTYAVLLPEGVTEGMLQTINEHSTIWKIRQAIEVGELVRQHLG